MAYPEFRLDGLPIGSGAIKSAADRPVQRRMKRAGLRRSNAGAHVILAIRAASARAAPSSRLTRRDPTIVSSDPVASLPPAVARTVSNGLLVL
jgi:hypothetical protein